MAARYVEIGSSDMESFMSERGFVEKTCVVGNEIVYERDRTKRGEVVVRVWSSVGRGSDSAREVGADAIRVQLVWIGEVLTKSPPTAPWEKPPATALGTVLYACTRIHRTQGWREKLDGRMREAWLALRNVRKCGTCKELPMVERRARSGRTFYGCIGWRKDGTGCLGNGERIKTYLFATARQLTGKPYVFHGYVYDRRTGRPVAACQHSHRSHRTAIVCALSMMKRTLRDETTATGRRVSSTDPSLQNIPVRTDLGREIRKAFRTDDGPLLLSRLSSNGSSGSGRGRPTSRA